MATGTLTGSTIAATYKSLLKVKGGANTILDGDIQIIEDGDGVDSVLGLATDSALISGDGNKLYFYDADGDEHISADASGVLSIAAGAEIDLTATAIDINGTVDLSSTLVVNSNTTITTADNTDTLTLISTDADANVGPVLNLKRSSGSPSDNDLLGEIKFSGLDSGGGAIAYFRLSATTLDVTDNTEDGKLVLTQTVNSSDIDVLSINATEMVFNEGGADKDFRVEGVGAANALFVQGSDGKVGIGVEPTGVPPLQVNAEVGSAVFSAAEFLRLAGGTGAGEKCGIGFLYSGAVGNKPHAWIGSEIKTWAGYTDGELVFATRLLTSNTEPIERMRIDSAGDVTFTGDLIMADGKGIDFAAYTDGSVAGSTTSQILKDYEEGTWTPSIGEGSSAEGTWTSALGWYTKIGDMVTIWFGITGSGMYFSSERGYMTITGIPFTAANPAGQHNNNGSWGANSVAKSIAGCLYLNTSTAYLHAANTNWDTSGVTGIGASISYRV